MSDISRFGRVAIHPVERRLTVEGTPVALGARAFDLLLSLIERRERTVSKAELLDAVWPGLVVEENNLAVHISALRKVLGREAIATIPGRGYRFALVPDPDTAPAPAAARTNVSALPHALVGRDADVSALEALLCEQRLIVIHGPGGIGKTRLAQQVALRRVAAHADGVWWADLSGVASAEGIAPAIAAAAQLQLGSADDASALLTRALRERDLLLVLDNCERLAGDVAAVVQRILDGTRTLRILATSQEALRCGSEHRYRLDALAVPPADAAPDAARTFAALQLLEQRARAADHRFRLTPAAVTAAGGLCRSLDGNALAIEMAAARLPVLGIDALCARLVDRLRLFHSGGRDAPARQQSLRATLDWSHSLLSPGAQAVFRRLAAFAGPFRLDVAQAVAQGSDLDDLEVLDAFGELLDKSLLQLEPVDPPHYRLLESARLYAAERLIAAGESADAERRHGGALQRLADEAEQAFWVQPEDPWLERYRFEYADIEQAFERACATGAAEVAAATAEVLGRINTLRSINTFARRRMDACHALLGSAEAAVQARLWDCVISHRVVFSTRVPRLEAGLRRVAAWRPLQEPVRLYRALVRLAVEWAVSGDFDAARASMAEAQALEDPAWPPRLRYEALSHEALVAVYSGDVASQLAFARRKLALAERAGAVREAARARNHVADATLAAGDVAGAIALGRDAARTLRALDQPAGLGVALANLCDAFLLAGDLAAAAEAACQAWPLLLDNDVAECLFEQLALLAARHGAHEAAAQLLGASDARYARERQPRQPNERRLALLVSAEIAASLGSDGLERLRGVGGTLDPGAALDVARGVLAAAAGAGAQL